MAKQRKGGRGWRKGWNRDPMRQLMNKAHQYRSSVNRGRITQRVGIFTNAVGISPGPGAKPRLETTERDRNLNQILARNNDNNNLNPLDLFAGQSKRSAGGGGSLMVNTDHNADVDVDAVTDFLHVNEDRQSTSDYRSPRKRVRGNVFKPPLRRASPVEDEWSIGTCSTDATNAGQKDDQHHHHHHHQHHSPQEKTLPELDMNDVAKRLIRSCPKAPLVDGLSYNDAIVQRLTDRLSSNNPHLISIIRDRSKKNAAGLGSGCAGDDALMDFAVNESPPSPLVCAPAERMQPQTESLFSPVPHSPYTLNSTFPQSASTIKGRRLFSLNDRIAAPGNDFMHFFQMDEDANESKEHAPLLKFDLDSSTSSNEDDPYFGLLGLDNRIVNDPVSPELAVSLSADDNQFINHDTSPFMQQFESPSVCGSQSSDRLSPPSTGKQFLAKFFEF